MKGFLKAMRRSVMRKAINREKDPYLLQLPPHDMAACRKCGAVYHEKRWTFEKATVKKVFETKGVKEVLCPACQKVRDRFVEGYVTIEGDFSRTHRDEILHLIRNKEKIEMGYNPLNRIVEIKEKDNSIEVTTTTERLAQKLGQVLKKAFHADVEYQWSSDVKLARVYCRRVEG